MRKLGGLLLAVGLWVSPALADSSVDVVHMKSGGRFQGTVIEEDPSLGVTLKLVDGTVKKIPRADIASVAYANTAAPDPAPIPSVPPPSASLVSSLPSNPTLVQTSYGPPSSSQPPNQSDRGTTAFRPLWLTGLIFLSVTYPLTVAITSGIEVGTGDNRAGTVVPESAIPVVGPWVILADGGNSPSAAQAGALVFSGVVQGAGLACLIAGLSIRVPKDRSRSHAFDDMTVVPWAPSTVSGLSVVGRF